MRGSIGLQFPPWLTVVGYVLFVVSMVGIAWVLRVNKYAEPRVRIQAERGQTVIDTGPYAVVRHPFYVLAVLLFGGIPLCLGSLWALLPAACAIGLLVLRTALEDRLLHASWTATRTMPAASATGWSPASGRDRPDEFLLRKASFVILSAAKNLDRMARPARFFASLRMTLRSE